MPRLCALSMVVMLACPAAALVAAPQTTREVRAQEPAPPGIPREQLAGEGWPILEWRHATGEWGGLRSSLRDLGIDAEVFLTTDASIVAGGGVNPRGTALRSLLDATLTIDGDRLLGLPRSVVFADFQLQRGDNVSTDVGDLQGVSNIDSANRTQLAKLWYEQRFADDLLRVKLGKIDANSDFAYVEHGYRFMQSSFGYSPTIVGLPTYPDPSFGAAAFLHPGAGLHLAAGVFDGSSQAGFPTGPRGPRRLFGAPQDLFAISEIGLHWGTGDDELAGRFAVAVFRHTGDFARFDGGTDSGTDGVAVTLDQTLRRTGDDDGEGLGAFLQYGYVDPAISPISHHIGGGLAWTGMFSTRPNDAVGVGFSHGVFSREPGAGLTGDGELVIEVFYTLQVSPWLRLKPDVQWVHDPGGQAGVDDALVLTLRTAVTF